MGNGTAVLNVTGHYCSLPPVSTWVICKTLVLIAFNVVVVAGNGLVVVAVFKFRKLRNTTGVLITSLAVADLLVGVFVLPFSAVNELSDQVWLFGEIWCQMWLAVDVLMCTASIYNLVAISLDRYIAILRPLQYRSLVTSNRKRLLVLFTWIISFIICSPPMLIQWPEAMSSSFVPRCTCSPMGNSPMYIIYSAMGSFFIPFTVVVIMYARIYWTARAAYAGRHSGVMSVASSTTASATSTPCVLRVHRGGTVSKTSGVDTPTCHRNSEENGRLQVSPHVRRDTHSDYLENSSKRVSRDSRTGNEQDSIDKNLIPALNELKSYDFNKTAHRGGRRAQSHHQVVKTHSYTLNSEDSPMHVRHRSLASLFHPQRTIRRIRTKRSSAASNRYQRRLSTEMKASKTVAIVTGCFIFCWIGFAVTYAISALPQCQLNPESCVSPTIFSLVFWLGYSNSAFNPIIYALFNRHFRVAFQQILTCCFKFNSSKAQYNHSLDVSIPE